VKTTASDYFYGVRTKSETAAELEVNTSIVTFLVRHANTTEEVPANENNVGIIVRARTARSDPVYLGIIADGDLVSESGTIPIENVICQASGRGSSREPLSKFIPTMMDTRTDGNHGVCSPIVSEERRELSGGGVPVYHHLHTSFALIL
jgi:hypothetical protein